jgi:hypothetical protein
MGASVEEQLTPVEVIIYRLALLRTINRQLLAKPPRTLDPGRARRALEDTDARLDEVIALLKALQP